MKRLSENQVNELKNLSKKGLSLRKIQQKTKIPLSTIQYRLNRNNNVSREKVIKIPSSEFTRGEIIGAFAGDGNYYHNKSGRSGNHYVRYYLSYKEDKNYATYLSSILKNMGLNVNKYITMNKNEPSGLELRTSSVNFIRFIKNYIFWQNKKTYSVQLKKDIKLSNNFLFGFARGVMDTDGYVESHGVACELTSKNLINDLKNIVSIIKIKPKVTVRIREGRKDMYRLRISKGYLKTYQKYIGFSNPRKKKKVLKILKIK